MDRGVGVCYYSSLQSVSIVSEYLRGGGRPALQSKAEKRFPYRCLCNPAQVGGISSRTLLAFVSHPAACVVVALGVVLLNAETIIAREQEWLILACPGARREEKRVAFTPCSTAPACLE